MNASTFPHPVPGAVRDEQRSIALELEQHRTALVRRAEHALSGRLRSKFDPADLAQDTLIRANASIAHFHGSSPRQVRSWLHAIMAYTLAEYHRLFGTEKRNLRREVQGGVSGESTNGRHHLLTASQQRWRRHQRDPDECLDKLLEALPARLRFVLIWRFQDECTFSEIGQRLQMTRPGAAKLYKRALAEVRRLLWPARE